MKISRTLRILVSVILLLSFPVSPLDAMDDFDRNIHLYRKIARYKEALKQNPDDQEALRNLAVTFGQVKLYTQAQECCRRLISLDPSSGRYRYNLAWTWHKMGRLEEAVREYGEALKLDPSIESAGYNRAVAQVSLKAYRDALETARQGLKVHTQSAKLRLVEGEALKGLKKYPEAIESTRRATELFPAGFDGWYLLASLHALRNDGEQARKAFDRARAIDGKALEYAREDDDFASILKLLEEK